MTEHTLKCWPEFYQAIVENRKPFEYRFNDRNYQVDDVLHLREWVPTGDITAASYEDDGGGVMDTSYYTGRSLRKRVTYVLPATELGPHAKDRHATHVVMGLGPLHVGPDIEPAPWVPMSDPRDIKVIGKLLEELGEGVSAAARSLIQGIDGTEPSSGRVNRDWLQNELGDIGAQTRLNVEQFGLDGEAMLKRAVTKYEFIRRWLDMMST